MGKSKDKVVTKEQQIEFWKHNIHPILGYKIQEWHIQSRVKESFLKDELYD